MKNPHLESEGTEHNAGGADSVIITGRYIATAAECAVYLDKLNPNLGKSVITSVDCSFAEIQQFYPKVRA